MKKDNSKLKKHTLVHAILTVIFTDEPGLAGCLFNAPAPFITELRILLGQA